MGLSVMAARVLVQELVVGVQDDAADAEDVLVAAVVVADAQDINTE